jgi:hypothetical protein
VRGGAAAFEFGDGAAHGERSSRREGRSST